jgi:aminoglycoside 3-N-acetyltransferase
MPMQERTFVRQILGSLHVPANAVLLVHSGIKGLNRQGYRAEAIIEAMLEYLHRGTLLMPTMTWRTVNPVNPVWDERGTPSHTGVLTEIFRARYSTARSLHPTHSVAGCGRDARVLLSGHHLGTTPAPAGSPYGLMRDYPAHILLLGVGMEMCTAIHHPEEMIAPEIYVKPMTDAESYTLKTREGRVIDYRLRRHPRLPRSFDKFIPELVAAGMQTGDIRGVPWSLMRVSDLMKIVFARLLDDPHATLNHDPS